MRIATSLCPTKLDLQLACVANLRDNGFEVVLVQPASEAPLHVDGVEMRFCKTCPPTIDDLLAALPDDDYGGIINSDIFLKVKASAVRAKLDASHASLIGQRWECNEWREPQNVFELGFDYFFFHGRAKPAIASSVFRIGRPAWDYWIPLKLLQAGPVVLVTEPLALHVKHPYRWPQAEYADYVRHLMYAAPECKNPDGVLRHILAKCARESIHNVGKTVIFIRSYAKDAPWLEYNLRSIKRFTSGFAYTMVVAPSRDHAIFAPMAERWGARLHEYDVREGKGMLHGMVKLCRADELCPDADNFLFTDSDCIFVEPVAPLDYFVNGRPALFAESFAKLSRQPDAMSQSRLRNWRPTVVAALGFDPPYETMVRQPIVHPRGIFAPFRAAVEQHVKRPFDEYVFAQRNEFPQGFSEFPALGAFAIKHHAAQYHIADVETASANDIAMSGHRIGNSRVLTKWSHGGLTPRIKAEFEKILA